MEIEQSAIYGDILKVLNDTESRTNFSWDLEFQFTMDGKPQTLKPLKVLGLTIKRNYVSNYADEITCRVLLPLGKYSRRIYPNRTKLQAVLKRKQLKEQVSKELNHPNDLAIDTYTAIILTEITSAVEGQGTENLEEETLDLMSLLEIDFQLISATIESVRTVQVGGIYSNVKLDRLMQTFLTNLSGNKITNVDIFPISNTSTIKQLVIPHGTLLIDVPGFLQDRVGVYNAGLGSYIQDSKWYVYSLYDVTKFEDTLETVTVFILPQNKFANIERSYRVKNGSTVILITGKTSYIDSAGINVLNFGDGSRIVDPNSLINVSSKTKDNKNILSRKENNSEFVDVNARTKINYSPNTKGKITGNSFKTYSLINRNIGAIFKAVWQSAEPSILRPGARVKIVYDDDGSIVELSAVLLGCEYISIPIDGVTGEVFNNQAILTFFIKS